MSRTTATAAYAALRDEGFLASRRGSGSWTRLPADPGAAAPVGPSGEDVIDLSCAACAAPEGALHAALVAASAELPRHLPGPGYDAAGLPTLRAAIAAGFAARGVPTVPEQVFVTAGALHAFTLLLRVLAGPGDRVLTEHPTYAAALDAVRAAGARPVPVPMHAGGWDLDMLEATLRQAAPRLAYVIPDHQNPTGLTMTAAERVAAGGADAGLADAAGRRRDDPGARARRPAGRGAGRRARSRRRDRDHDRLDEQGLLGRACGSAGSAPPPHWCAASSAARAALDICSPVLEQLVAVELLARADEVLERQRAAARARRDTFIAALRAQLPEWRVPVPAGGLSLWAELDAPRSTALAAIADRYGLRAGRRPALRRRRRLRALRPPPVQPPGAGAGGRRVPPGGRLARGQRLHPDPHRPDPGPRRLTARRPRAAPLGPRRARDELPHSRRAAAPRRTRAAPLRPRPGSRHHSWELVASLRRFSW